LVPVINFSLGADGMAMGSRLATSSYSPLHQNMKDATVAGDYHKGVQFIGQTQGLINDQPSVQQIFDTLRQNAQAVHKSNTCSPIRL
jgi:NAD(P)H-dependent flavin oxidoreductase YrpB (nitropropane dioxygenase family)